MKQNNVRSFEHYQQMIEQSKNKSKPPTEHKNPTQIQKNINPANSSFHKQSSKEKPSQNRSSSKKSPNKIDSPNRHKNISHSPGKKVSYAELELILQNIDMIKNRARQQIEVLSIKNKKLTDDIQVMKQKYEEAKNSSSIDLEKERKKLNELHENSLKQFQKRLQQIQVRQRIWTEQKQQYIQEILNFKESIRIDLATIKDLEQTCEKEQAQKIEWKGKYQALVSLLTAGKPQRVSQLVYQLKQNYEGWAVSDIFLDRGKKTIILEKEIEKIECQKAKIEELLSQEKAQKSKTQQIVDKLMAQNKSLLVAISSKQKQHRDSITLINQQVSKMRQINSNLSQQLYSLQNDYKSRLSQIESYKQTIASLRQKLELESQKIKEITAKNQLSNINRKYFNVVDEQCQELQQISKVLAKMEVLQKCKIENRQNVQKIQFLCKMLDC